jgi:hypothetical protein
MRAHTTCCLIFAALSVLFAVSASVSRAQTTEPAVRSLYGKVFVYRNEPGAAFRPEFGITNEELHISSDGSVTALMRVVTVGTEQQRRGYSAGQTEAWATGRLSGRAFRLRSVKDPNYEAPFLRFEVSPDGLTIRRGDGAVYTRQ